MANLTSSLTIKVLADTKQAKTAAQALRDVEKNARAAAKAMEGSGATDRFTKSLAGLKLQARDIDTVRKAWGDYAKSAGLAADASKWTKAQAADVRAWERQTVAALKSVKREQMAFTKAQAAAVAKAEATAGATGVKGAVGAGLVAGRFGLGKVLALGAGAASGKTAVEAATARAHEMARARASGMTPEEMAEASAAAGNLAKQFPAIKQTELLHMLRNARSIVGSYEEAAQIMEPLARLRAVAQGARPGQDVSEDFDQLVKGLEIKGVTQNHKSFQEYMEGIAKGLNVFGDTLKPYQYYEMFKYGRQATPGLSSNFILGTAPTLAQELGGSSYGNAVSAFNRAIVGGKMDHAAFKTMLKLGLIDNDAIEYTKSTHEAKGLKAGRGAKGWALAQSDPNEWVKQYLLPALAKNGYSDPEKVQQLVGQLFSNRSAAQLVSILATQQSRIEKDLALLRHAPGLSAADDYMKHDPKMAWAGLKNSLDNLAGTLGEGTTRALAPVMTEAARAIGGYTAELAKMNAHREAHPDEPSLGQKKANRWLNAVMGYSSDAALPDVPLGERNRADWQAERDRLKGIIGDRDELRRRLGELPTAPGARHEYNRGLGKLKPRLDAAFRLDEIDKAHAATQDAQGELDRFRRNLPRDMRLRGEARPWVPGSRAFSLDRGWGGYDPTTGTPKVDTKAFDEAAQKATAAGDKAKEALDVTLKPTVDMSSIDAFLDKVRQAKSEVAGLGAATSAANARIGNIGKAQRERFSFGGVQGE